MSIPQETIDLIKERLSIVDLISETVQLKRAGRNFVGLCPFHSEKTPSFSVREEEGTFHCFGCGKSGTIFNFVMETRGFSFPEAARFLASRAGIVIEDTEIRSEEDDRMQQRRKELRELLSIVERIFRAELEKSKRAQSYLTQRGLLPETIQTFRLGYAPKAWDFLRAKVVASLGDRLEALGGEKGVEAALCEVGLLKRREEGTYDAFRDRVIFPITRSDGAVIAFGGRAMENLPDTPKYINSSESPIYQKRKTLFGVHPALKDLRTTRQAILVEGYMDVITLAQCGVGNVVATCGTSVTAEHAQVLRRLVETVLVVFDGDEAGRKAAARCYEVFLNSGVDVMAVLLPDGEDPDSYARAHSAEECREFFEAHSVPLLQLFVDSLRSDENGGVTPASVGKIASTVSAIVARLKNPVEKEFSLRFVADRLGVSVESFDQMVRQHCQKAAERESINRKQSPERSKSETVRPETGQSKSVVSGKHREKRTVKSRESLFPLVYEQLLIAVLCIPQLARNVLEMPTFGGGDAPSAILPDNVRQVLRELSVSDSAGVTKDRIPDRPKDGMAALFPELATILTTHGLDAERLLSEACRVVTIGGSHPQKLVAEVGQAAEREYLQREVQAIKVEEANEPDAGRLERLAQEKLLKKRNLERLRPNG